MIRYYNHNMTSPETYKPGDNIIYLGKYDERDIFYPGRIEVIESLIDDNHATLLDRSGVYDISDFAYYDVSLVINDSISSFVPTTSSPNGNSTCIIPTTFFSRIVLIRLSILAAEGCWPCACMTPTTSSPISRARYSNIP